MIKLSLKRKENKKRKSVSKGPRQLILKAQQGKCAKCKRSFKQLGVRGHSHHKNLNPNDNKPSNIIIVCPNCHDKIHQTKRKVRVKKNR